MRNLVTAVAAGGLMILGGCNSGTVADLAKYCDLARQLDEAGAKAAEQLDADAGAEEFSQAASEFVDDNRDEIEELKDVAPDEIADEVEELADASLKIPEVGQEAMDGTEDADATIRQFEEANCGDAEGDDGSPGEGEPAPEE